MARGWLIGMMGSGKSAIGRQVAFRLDLPFIDTDRAIETERHMTIEEIWEEGGEQLFRRLEADMIRRVALQPALIATGGGAVLRSENVEVMRRSGPVIWLRASVDTLNQRLGEGRNRPLLAGSVRDRLETLDAERAASYATAATLTIDTDDLSLAETVMAVEAML